MRLRTVFQLCLIFWIGVACAVVYFTRRASAQTYRGPNGEILAPVTTPIPATPVVGQVIIATTGTAVQLPAAALYNGIVVKAKASNNAACGAVGSSSVTNVYTGSGNGYGLCPGEASSFAVNNANALWVNGTVGDIFTYQGN